SAGSGALRRHYGGGDHEPGWQALTGADRSWPAPPRRRAHPQRTGGRDARMPEPLCPRLLVALCLTLEGGPCPLLALLGADHDPALGALGQVRLEPTPPVPRPLGAAAPALLPVLSGVQPFLHPTFRTPE